MATIKENSDLSTQKITLSDFITWCGIIVGMVVSYYSGRTSQALTDQAQDFKIEQLAKDQAKVINSNDEIIRLLKRINPDKDEK
jgi:LEA14-like dessication related protein